MFFRAHEWLADRVSWVQYPELRRLSPKRRLFRNEMPWTTRAMLILIGSVLLLGCAVALFFLGVLSWAAITA